MPRGSTYEEDRAKARAEKLKIAQEEWNKAAESYGWVDKDKGVAHIPIQRAMELELADLQAKKPDAGRSDRDSAACRSAGHDPGRSAGPRNPPTSRPVSPSAGRTASVQNRRLRPRRPTAGQL